MVISLVGIDADDTLWHSENHFVVTEDRFQNLLEPWLSGDQAAKRLLDRERANLRIFGYGIKGFTLSMIETAIEASAGSISIAAVETIIGWGKDMLTHPVELLPDVAETMNELALTYRLALITKGDLFHQESKIAESGLAELFETVEILSEKAPPNYQRVIDRVGVPASEFVMVGNSVRSDVLPVLELGARAVHVPYHVTWGHEHVDGNVGDWHELERFSALPGLLRTMT
jgi:putative hydrolase of the HAD superfamily